MKKQVHILIIFFILILSGCSFSTTNSSEESIAEKGVIAIDSKYLSRSSVVRLNGEWAFYWRQLLLPHEVEHAQLHNTTQYTVVPSSWASDAKSKNGYATYSLTVKIPESLRGQAMGIYIPYQNSSYILWVDGIRSASNGYVGNNKESSEPAFRKELVYFTPENSEIHLTMQIANFEYVKSGASQSILFGRANAISMHYTQLVASTLLIIGAILVMGVYQLSLFIFRRQEKAFLYFGIVSILVAARALFIEPFYFTVLFPNFSWIWQIRFEFLITYTAYPLYLLFLRFLYPKEMSKLIVQALTLLSLTLFGITLFTHPLIFLPLFNYFMVVGLLTILYVLFVIIMAIRHKRRTAILNLTASLLFFIAMINDAFVYLDWITGINLATYGFFLFIFIQSINLSRNYAKKFEESEILANELREFNESLDKKIQARTKELEMMNEKLHELTFLDSLTGLYNRRFFDQKMLEKIKEMEQMNRPLTLLLIDLDDFKKYNDTYGHVMGDELIQKAASIFKEVVGLHSCVVRYGGEEFAIILPGFSQEQGHVMAEDIRMAMENLQEEHSASSNCKIVTLSVGGTSSSHHSHTRPEDWIKLADLALYESKNKGRNCVTML